MAKAHFICAVVVKMNSNIFIIAFGALSWINIKMD